MRPPRSAFLPDGPKSAHDRRHGSAVHPRIAAVIDRTAPCRRVVHALQRGEMDLIASRPYDQVPDVVRSDSAARQYLDPPGGALSQRSYRCGAVERPRRLPAGQDSGEAEGDQILQRGERVRRQVKSAVEYPLPAGACRYRLDSAAERSIDHLIGKQRSADQSIGAGGDQSTGVRSL